MSEMRETLVVVASYGTRYADRWQNGETIIRTDCPGEEGATPYKGFDTGAYLWAYWTIPAKKYLFVQDSLTPKPGYAELFFKHMPEFPVVGWCGFPFPMWDTPEQAIASQFAVPGPEPEHGIFGPIFAATREALDTLRDNQLLPGIPNHKLAAQGKEREWAMAFTKMGLPLAFLCDFLEMQSGNTPAFTKEFGGRQ